MNLDTYAAAESTMQAALKCYVEAALGLGLPTVDALDLAQRSLHAWVKQAITNANNLGSAGRPPSVKDTPTPEGATRGRQ